jgi:predicted HicB family RNase H-like nuclease
VSRGPGGPWLCNYQAEKKETSAVLTQSKEKYQEVLQVAKNLYQQTPDWVTFFREVLGIDGVVRKAFPAYEDLTEFEQSEEYEQIQQCLVKLREKRTIADPETEPTRVITVRLPKSMHEYLRTEAHDLRTSMNKLCISKLLQMIGEEKIPNERANAAKQVQGGAPTSMATPQPAAVQAAMAPAPTLAQQTQLHPIQRNIQPLKPLQPRF